LAVLISDKLGDHLRLLGLPTTSSGVDIQGVYGAYRPRQENT